MCEMPLLFRKKTPYNLLNYWENEWFPFVKMVCRLKWFWFSVCVCVCVVECTRFGVQVFASIKCRGEMVYLKWNLFEIFQSSSFRNANKIMIGSCNRIKTILYAMLKLLSPSQRRNFSQPKYLYYLCFERCVRARASTHQMNECNTLFWVNNVFRFLSFFFCFISTRPHWSLCYDLWFMKHKPGISECFVFR